MIDIQQGACLELLRAMPAESVRCCVTSPPYWGLRDYGTATWDGGSDACEHKGPPMQSGKSTLVGNGHGAGKPLSPTLQEQRQPGRDVCRCGARRVDQQLGLERTPEEYVARLVDVFREVRRVLTDDGTLWLNLGDSYAARSYQVSPTKWEKLPQGQGSEVPFGLKPKDLVGIPWRVAFALQADGWWLRQDIIWAKPNPMPESVTDRCTKAHEYVFLLSKSARYYYDAAAIAWAKPDKHCSASAADPKLRTKAGMFKLQQKWQENGPPATVNARSVWTIATQPFLGAHFAVMPEALVEPCILAGSKPGDLVLDPFAGSGTVGVVALRHGRRFVGCELNQDYAQMAIRRVAGPLFAVLHTGSE